MPRDKLPSKRRTWRQKVKILDAEGRPQTFYLDVSEYPDGRPGEIWLTAHKQGTFVRGILDALARAVSVSLQCGTPLVEIVKALRGLNFPPNGEVQGSPAVVSCTSLADWVGKELAVVYLAQPVDEGASNALDAGEEPVLLPDGVVEWWSSSPHDNGPPEPVKFDPNLKVAGLHDNRNKMNDSI